MKEVDRLRMDYIKEMEDHLSMCTHNDFANSLEEVLGKESADFFRDKAIESGCYIKKGYKSYNTS